MRAMILAAGMGTRLRPLTGFRPKVLIPVMGMTILEFWVHQLHEAGFEAVVVNAHNLHERLVAEIRNRAWPLPVEVRVEPVLLGTGGGIRNVLEFFGKEPFAVVNGDIVSKVPFRALLDEHRSSGSLVSLLMHDRPDFNNVAVNGSGSVLGFGRQAGEIARQGKDVEQLAFTGIHIINPGILSHYPPGEPWEILVAYADLIRRGLEVKALFAPNLFWEEMGSVASYRALSRSLSTLPDGALSPMATGRALVVDPTAEVPPGAVARGFNVIGRGTRVMDEVLLQDCILWDGILVEPGSRLRNCIVADGVVVRGEHEDEIITRDGVCVVPRTHA
jgi:mannose-1-phosphate guanylyltransferase